jgi:hypothetical protein
MNPFRKAEISRIPQISGPNPIGYSRKMKSERKMKPRGAKQKGRQDVRRTCDRAKTFQKALRREFLSQTSAVEKRTRGGVRHPCLGRTLSLHGSSRASHLYFGIFISHLTPQSDSGRLGQPHCRPEWNLLSWVETHTSTRIWILC